MKVLRVLLSSLALLLVTFGAFGAERQVPSSRAEVQLSYAPLVEKAAPAVVNVYARRMVTQGSRSPFADDPFFSRFFGDQGPRVREQNSLGSGVIVRASGVIVTNNHVIAGGNEFTVVLADKREFAAEVLLQDEQTDLAILQIDGEGEIFPTLAFHDSDDAQVGDLVLAIGNPFGVGQTVTSGIISALARNKVGVSDYQFFIQTDAAINPGNSGGALITMNGDLIGVNTAIFSRSGGSNGIGFAIPANMVRLVVESALSDGKVERPWFGANGQMVTADLASTLGLKRPTGVLLTQLHPKGPADKAGLARGDVVLKIDGHDVDNIQALRYRVATQKVGSKAEVTYLRDGKTRTAKVKLAVPPNDPPADETELTGRQPLEGAVVVNLSPAYNDEHGLDTMLSGVAVKAIARRSAADRLGLRAGDIVSSVNGEEVVSVSQLEAIMEEGAARWSLTILRGNRELHVDVRG
ncbi:MAG: DegQ family serine endoprotease [Alphaproteobacteria bacterium]|nr:MAG: DegQ family serine endoprotease [Alphaproteobacteria bacterium]